MKRKKILTLLLVGTLVISTLITGCGQAAKSTNETSSEKTDSNKPVTIVWKRGKDATPAAQKIVDAFEKKYKNITVKIEDLPSTSTEQHNTYTTALAAGDDSFDIVTMDIVWATEFSSSGWLLPLDKYFTSDKQKEFFPGTVAALKYKNKIYAVPSSTDAGVFYYRKDLIKTPPKTWDELIKDTQENVGKNGIDTGFLFQAFQNEALVCNAAEFIYGNGGSILDKNGKVVLDSQKAIAGVKTMKDLIDKNISPKGVVTYKPQDCIDQFEQGKTLFMRNWCFAYSSLTTDAKSTVKDKVGIAVLPVGADGKESGSTLGGWNLGINKNSKNPDAAWKFIQFATGDEGQKINAIEGAYMPTKEKIYKDKDVLAKFPQFSDLLPIFKTAKPRPVSPYYAKISDALQVNLHKALIGDSPIDVSVKEAAKEVDAIINNK